MATLEHNTNHEQSALDRFLEQFKAKQNFTNLVKALCGPVQDIEDALWSLYTNRLLDDSDGVQLDNLGVIVGQARQGRNDPDYLQWIKARIRVNRSNGQGNDLLDVLSLVLDENAQSSMVESPPAAVTVRVYNYSGSSDNLFDILTAAKAGGVRLSLEFSTRDEDSVFTFAPGADIVEGDLDRGFADTDESTGGHLADVLA